MTTVVIHLGGKALRELQQMLDFELLSGCRTLADVAEVRRDISDLDPAELSRLAADAISMGGSCANTMLTFGRDKHDRENS